MTTPDPFTISPIGTIRGDAEAFPVALGDLGLSPAIVGTVVQSLANVIAERETLTRAQLVAFLTGPAFDEGTTWDALGAIVDDIETAATAWVESEGAAL